MKTLRGQKGFTLIEVLIVLFIIGMMMGLGVSILFPGNSAKLRNQAAKFAGTIKFLYDDAAVKNKYYRLVFDLDNHSYSIESSSDPFLVSLIDVTEKKKQPEPEKDPDASPSGAAFAEESELLAQGERLPQGIKFKDISVMHLKDRQESGKVEAYFFPNGFVEPMVINLSDDEEESFYSLEVNPMTGKAKIRSEYLEANPEQLNPSFGGQKP